jgi:hypothetical protein
VKVKRTDNLLSNVPARLWDNATILHHRVKRLPHGPFAATSGKPQCSKDTLSASVQQAAKGCPVRKSELHLRCARQAMDTLHYLLDGSWGIRCYAQITIVRIVFLESQ